MQSVIQKVKPLYVAIAVVAALLAMTVMAVHAQEEAQGGSGVSISPTRTELSTLPGASDEVTITVRNVTNSDIIARPLLNDFEADENNGGAPKLLGPGEESAQSIASFVKGLEDVPLAPNESKDITFTIEVPQAAFPGGYFGAIRFQAVPTNELGEAQNGQISLTASVASLVLVEVPGDIRQDVQIDYVSASVGDNEGTIFTSKPDFSVVSVTNNGDSFIKPFGTVKLSNFSGDTLLSYELNDLQPRGNVLPESTRLFKDQILVTEKRTLNGEETEEQFNPIKWPGRYTLTADVSYGSGGEVFTVSSTFWYVPSWLIIVLIVLLLGLIGLGFFLYNKYTTRSTKRRR